MATVVPFIILVNLLIGLGIPLALMAILVMFLTRSQRNRARAGMSDTEARQLEQVWNRLERMDKRIANLETILNDRPHFAPASSARN